MVEHQNETLLAHSHNALKGNWAFIDNYNVFSDNARRGWTLCWKKFRILLQDTYGVTQAFQHLGYIRENQRLYRSFRAWGYEPAFMPARINPDGTIRANVDHHLIVKCLTQMEDYEKAVIVAGDNYSAVYDHLIKLGKLKLIVLPSFQCASPDLDRFADYFFIIDQHRRELEYTPKSPRGNGHGPARMPRHKSLNATRRRS